MHKIIQNSIDDLNKALPKKKKIINEDTFLLIDKKSNLDSIDLVNLFVILEKNLKKEKNLTLTFDTLLKDIDELKTIGTLKSYLYKKIKNDEQ
jgi:acyl carrier protein|tara:strand:+ start:1294 stop:1572 length:279 start_codon:yes stop_codon:yes gene_type:complete